MTNLEILVKEAPELGIGSEFETIYSKQEEVSYIPSIFTPKVNRKLVLLIIDNLSSSHGHYKKGLYLKQNPQIEYGNRMEYLYPFNFEIGKAIGNIIDLLKSANIQPADMYNYYETLLTGLKLETFIFKDNLLQTAMQYARYNNLQEQLYNNPEINLRPSVFWNLNLDDSFTKAGRVLNPIYENIFSRNLWSITSELSKSYRLLPKSIEANFEQYQNQLMETWLHFVKLLDFLGHDWDSVGRIYSVYYYSKLTKQNKDGKPRQ